MKKKTPSQTRQKSKLKIDLATAVKIEDELRKEINMLILRLAEARRHEKEMSLKLYLAQNEIKKLEQVTNKLKIQDAGDGPVFKNVLSNARKNPTYWTEYCSLLEERISAQAYEIENLKYYEKRKRKN